MKSARRRIVYRSRDGDAGRDAAEVPHAEAGAARHDRLGERGARHVRAVVHHQPRAVRRDGVPHPAREVQQIGAAERARPDVHRQRRSGRGGHRGGALHDAAGAHDPVVGDRMEPGQ